VPEYRRGLLVVPEPEEANAFFPGNERPPQFCRTGGLRFHLLDDVHGRFRLVLLGELFGLFAALNEPRRGARPTTDGEANDGKEAKEHRQSPRIQIAAMGLFYLEPEAARMPPVDRICPEMEESGQETAISRQLSALSQSTAKLKTDCEAADR